MRRSFGRWLLALLVVVGTPALAAESPHESELRTRRIELVALDRYAGHLRGLVAAAERGDLLLRDDRVGVLRAAPRADLAELAQTVAALPQPVRSLARPALPAGSVPDLLAALAAETRALVERELRPLLSRVETDRATTAERIGWLEREIARSAAEAARIAEEQARLEAERQRVEAERARLEAERQRVETERRKVAEAQERVESELARIRAAAPGPAAPVATPVAAPVLARRAWLPVDAQVEARSVRVAPADGGGIAQQISVSRTSEGFVLFNLWLDQQKRIGSFVCAWALRGLDDPIVPGRDVTLELVGRCDSEAGPPLPTASVLRLETEGLTLVGEAARSRPEVWTGTRDGRAQLEVVRAFVLRPPKAAKPGDTLQLRLVQPGCCTPLTLAWRYAG